MRSFLTTTLLFLSVFAPLCAEEKPVYNCSAESDFFAEQVWPKVGARSCLKCHQAGGDAEETKFVLRDPQLDSSLEKQESLAHNRAMFKKVAAFSEEDEDDWLVLLKVTDEYPHDGGEVLAADSVGYRILETFVRGVHGEPVDFQTDLTDAGPFFEGVTMVSDRRLLRRLTLSLSGRLPTETEYDEVGKGGMNSLDAILDRLMSEDAFYERLAEAFNDILLIRGYDGLPERALSYEHFPHRHWPQKFDYSFAGDDPQAQKKAQYKLTDDYREAMLREPLELINFIVRNDRPFTEILTADFTMMSPYTARGYGVFEQLQDQFENPDDPFEFIPAKIPALVSRDGRSDQKSETGHYPHAGVLSSFQYLMRFPTTETNRNRLRVRMFYQHFLGIDIMALAPRVNDAAAITAEYEIPTMEASDCVVCHKVIDPVAGVFQDFYVVDAKGVYGPRKDGWYEDMFAPGFKGEALQSEDQWQAIPWLGQRAAKDPRFPVAMVEHVFYILFGRRPLLPPEDLDDPLFDAKQRAYRVQRNELESVAHRFANEGDFNLKFIFKQLAKSRFYRADGIQTAIENPNREAELREVGVARMLTPEQLERKCKAIFGERWGKLNDHFEILYGGINAKTVTDRNLTPSGAMGAIQRMMANEMACKHVAREFSTPREDRRFFTQIEGEVRPGESDEMDEQIRQTITRLHQIILDRDDLPQSDQVTRTFQLFANVISDAEQREGLDQREIYHCRGSDDQRLPDPFYTIRAWRAVMTYLLRRQEFLYE